MPRRGWIGLGLLSILGSWLLAQEPAKPPASKAGKDEEWETVKPKTKKPIVIDDDLPPPPATGPKRTLPTDLMAAAADSKHAVVRALYQKLRVPFDLVKDRKGVVRRMQPFPEASPTGGKPTRSPNPTELTADGQPGTKVPYTTEQIEAAIPFELSALRECEAFLNQGHQAPVAAGGQGIPLLEQFQACEIVLRVVLRFHDAGRESGVRAGAGWDDTRKLLSERLAELQTKQLEQLMKTDEWDAAAELAADMAAAGIENMNAQARVVQQQLGLAKRTLEAGTDADYIVARQIINRLRKQFPRVPDDGTLTKLLEQLKLRADKLRQDGDGKEKAQQQAEALTLYRTAESIYPGLPEVQSGIRRIESAYPVLYVSVPVLPDARYCSPRTASTDGDRYAVELLYEGLVSLATHSDTGVYYRPALARALPVIKPLERHFPLTPDAVWPVGDGSRPVTATDVAETLKALQADLGPRGDGPDQLEPAPAIRDPFQIPLRLRQGHPDPLTLMAFKIEPPADVLALNQNKPIGSGPYLFGGKTDDNGRPAVVFTANPFFGKRVERRERPLIREIRLVGPSADPTKELLAGRLHVVTQVPTAQFRALQGPSGRLAGAVTFVTVPSRRIQVLAVNHRHKLQSQELRQAVSAAIDREQVLNEVYRAGTSEFHRTMSGPYPPGCWAIAGTPPPLYSPEKAAAAFNAIKAKFGGSTTLTFKYANDPLSVKAAGLIKTMIERTVPGLTLSPQALPPEQLREVVEITQAFDLALHNHDYPNEFYPLHGLFEPRCTSVGGRNYMGYTPTDDPLVREWQSLRAHRDFEPIRRGMQAIHDRWRTVLPFIPLWQLDQHLIISTKTTPVPGPEMLDPLTLFGQIDEWQLRR
jgi:ABC-type transport system substrate-binding protein